MGPGEPKFEQYLCAPLNYNYAAGPKHVGSFNEAERRGINCVSLAHLVIRDMYGVTLPPELHCYELATDTQLFKSVPESDEWLPGDLVFFGRSHSTVSLADFKPHYDASGYLLNSRLSPLRHVAIFSGFKEPEPLLIHSNPHDKGVGVWPLSWFSTYAQYESLIAVRRLRSSAVLEPSVNQPIDLAA